MSDKTVYLVVMDRGGVFGAYFSPYSAEETAEAIQGVVVALPVLQDFRPLDDRNASE